MSNGESVESPMTVPTRATAPKTGNSHCVIIVRSRTFMLTLRWYVHEVHSFRELGVRPPHPHKSSPPSRGSASGDAEQKDHPKPAPLASVGTRGQFGRRARARSLAR